jgi:hypothetical protein
MMHDDVPGGDTGTLRVVRGLLLAILLIGFIGTLAELFLLEHDEDAWQLIPIALLSAGTLAVTWTAVAPGAMAWRVFRVLMVLFVAAAGLGLFFHYRANVEFQRETDPSLASTALFWKVMAAKAPPALAPGVMAQLGLVGLVYSYGQRWRGGRRD